MCILLKIVFLDVSIYFDRSKKMWLLNEEIEFLARMCHEANARYCEMIGDPFLVWEQFSEERKQGVRDAVVSCVSVGADPRTLHEKWVESLLALGWKYGEVKDEEAKTHPCLVDYDLLSAAQKVKDLIFITVCETYKETVQNVRLDSVTRRLLLLNNT